MGLNKQRKNKSQGSFAAVGSRFDSVNETSVQASFVHPVTCPL